MNINNPTVVLEGQLSLFGTEFSEPILAAPKPERKRQAQHVREIQQEFEFMLEVLDTAEAICDVPEDWTEEDIIELCEYMLQRHLKFILDGRSGSTIAQEAWEWVLSEEIHPFSFRVCLDAVAFNTGLQFEGNVCVDRDDVRASFYAMAKQAKVPLNFSLIYS